MNACEFMMTNLFTLNATIAKINLVDIPQPKDSITIHEDAILCVNNHGTLNVEYIWGSLEFGIENQADLFECMMRAFCMYWCQEDKHLESIHESWHKYIESYNPLFIQYHT